MKTLNNPKLEKMKSLSIKKKVMYAQILISLFCTISITVLSIFVFRKIMIQNTEKLVNNLIKQISYNLDENVKDFESSSYQILDFYDINRLLDGDNVYDDPVEYHNKSRKFADVIIQQPSLYKHTKYACLKSNSGIIYKFCRSGMYDIGDKDIEDIINQASELVNKNHPIEWTVIQGETVFIRQILDEKTYDERGIICFIITPSFLDFIEDTQNIISNKNIIIANSNQLVMQNYEFDLEELQISDLVFDEDEKFFLKNYRIKYRDEKYLVTSVNTNQKSWKILSLLKAHDLVKNDRYIIFGVILIGVISLIISLIITRLISKSIVANITIIENSMEKVEKGDFKTRIKPVNYDEIGMLGLRFNYMTTKIEGLIDALSKERLAKQNAKFEALQAQINPHFLYNTLGSLKWLANRKKEMEIEGMIDALIYLMKSSIKNETFIYVSNEVEYIKSYIRLQKMRYGEVFDVIYEIEPDTLDCVILGFMLQPLVENCIYHGIDMTRYDNRIFIRFLHREEFLIIQVEDNGNGFEEEELFKIMNSEKQYEGFNSIGIKIINDRLKAYYSKQYTFNINSQVGVGTLVQITLPYEKNREGNDMCEF